MKQGNDTVLKSFISRTKVQLDHQQRKLHFNKLQVRFNQIDHTFILILFYGWMLKSLAKTTRFWLLQIPQKTSKRTLTCTRFRPWMQFFTSFISFTLSVAFNSVSLTVKWVFSFLAGAASSSAAWFHKGTTYKCVHFHVFFNFYQYNIFKR